ncbi:MAG: acyltransferase family protein [Thiotrichales bacterium]
MNQQSLKPHYRADIQGLRAIAVLGVIVFHAGLPLSDGFIGVDVFFVISGYVIGGLLLREFEGAGKFSAKEFYLRRARRLLPAVSTMVLVCLLLTIILVSPLGLSQKSAAQAAIASTFFSSNFYFWLFTGGYFDGTAASNPFLHTWSLGVEEQFYFVIPWVLLFGWKLYPTARIKGVALFGLVVWGISFIANIVFSFAAIPEWVPLVGPVVNEHPHIATNFSFYLPVTRAWEFLSGFLFLVVKYYWVPSNRQSIGIGSLGIVSIVTSYILIGKELPFPGIIALVPVVGTGLLLVAGTSPKANSLTKFLSAPPMVYVGNISYSWYLWHWPAVVFSQIWFATTVATTLASFFSIIPAILSYHLIEKPIHLKRWFQSDRNLIFVIIVSFSIPLLISVMTISGWKHSWWREDLQELHLATTQPLYISRFDCADVLVAGPGGESCLFEQPLAQGTVLLIGD